MREFGDSGENVVNLKGGLLAKSGKLIFQGRSFLEGKIQKNGKKSTLNFLKLKVDGTKVVSVFEFGPYFGSKWLFLSFLRETNMINMAFIGI